MGESNSLMSKFTTMNKFHSAAVAAFALVASSVTPIIADTVDSLEQLEQQFRELANAQADYETAVKWLDLAKGVKNENVRQILLKASAAAMLYARKMDDYTKKVRPLMVNAERFEESLHSNCPQCGGEGKEYEDCQSCHRTGKCPSPGCSGGYVEVRKRIIGGDLQPSASYSAGTRK